MNRQKPADDPSAARLEREASRTALYEGAELDVSGGACSGFSVSRRLIVGAALTLPVLGFLGCARATPEGGTPVKLLFFDAAERDFIDAATQRLIPDGDDGLGARAAGVVDFIDRQLAGIYGQAATWYMQGPWKKGTPEQGYQLALTPAQLYRTAIRDIDAHCRKSFDKVFAAMPAADRDTVLHGLEKGDIELPDTSAKEFFDMLLQNTQEGFLADPLYGGNRNFAGWRLIGFPGPRYNYVYEITQYGKPYPLPTVGLLGRDGNQVWS